MLPIMGESGSGKTTLLNILASLDKPTERRGAVERQKSISNRRERNFGV
mgnify:CR=1 FL=1